MSTVWAPIPGTDYGAAVATARRNYHPHANPSAYSWMDSPSGWGQWLGLFAGDAAKNYTAEGNDIAGVAHTVGTTADHVARIVAFFGRPLGQTMLALIVVMIVWHWWTK